MPKILENKYSSSKVLYNEQLPIYCAIFYFFNSDCLLSDIDGRGPLHMAAHCKGIKAKHVLDTLLQKG